MTFDRSPSFNDARRAVLRATTTLSTLAEPLSDPQRNGQRVLIAARDDLLGVQRDLAECLGWIVTASRRPT